MTEANKMAMALRMRTVSVPDDVIEDLIGIKLTPVDTDDDTELMETSDPDAESEKSTATIEV